jgi:putative membrane protein
MIYPILKALHVISMVAWFCGLLYLVRLYVYHVEAESKPELERKAIQDQLTIMEKRLLYYISHPAMLSTIVFGTILGVKYQFFLQPWLHLKVTFVLGLIAYHIYLGRIRKRLVAGTNTLSAKQLRILNEVGTVFLILIVLIAYTKISFR